MSAGEKVANAAISSLGMPHFATNRPVVTSSTSCLNRLGLAKIYSVPLFCKAASNQELIGGGLPRSPVTGFVSVNHSIDGKEYKKNMALIIGAPNAKKSAIEGWKIRPTAVPVRRKIYWYPEGQKYPAGWDTFTPAGTG